MKNRKEGQMSSVELGTIVNIRTGKLDANASSDNGEYPFFTCSRAPLKIDTYSYDCECVLVAGNGDLNVKYYSGKFDAYQRTYILEASDKRKLFMKYLYYFVDSIMDFIRSQSIGGVIKYIKLGDLTSLKLPLPSLERQREIAEVLDKASELVEKRKAQLAELDLLAESVFYDMFGDPVTNPKGWGICKVIEKTKCIVPGRDKPKSFTGDIPWITTADLNHLGYTSKANLFLSKDEIAEVKAKIIPKDSVIMTCVGDLGVVSIAENEMIINQQLHAFICDDVNNIFLAYNLSQRKDFMCKMASSTTVPYMNKTICNSIPIMLPPLSLQQQFAERIEKIEEQKQNVKTALKESENLFQRLMQDLFNPKAKS